MDEPVDKPPTALLLWLYGSMAVFIGALVVGMTTHISMPIVLSIMAASFVFAWFGKLVFR